MAEWLIEAGLGETRALCVEGDTIVAARIERTSEALRVGDVYGARLTKRLPPARGIVDLGGIEARLEPLPAQSVEGALLCVEVVRLPLPERGRPRLAKVRAVEGDAVKQGLVSRGPTLAEELATSGMAMRQVDVRDNRLEDAGWGDLLDQAQSGLVPFKDGMLAIALTPAMTLVDVDGDHPPDRLAVSGAQAAAEAICRFDIGGSIGIDLPTPRARDVRAAAANAVDAVLPQPFERTAVNGFGFLQIVRPRRRPSFLEYVQGYPTETAALLLLRQAERATGHGQRRLIASAAVIDWLLARPALTDDLRRRIGRDIDLTVDPTFALSDIHVDTAFH